MSTFSPIDPNAQNITDLVAKSDEAGFLKKIGGFAGEGAEISAYDPASKRLFVISGGTTLEVLDLSDPSQPTLVQTLDMSPYGGGANSVTIRDGVVAVAVEADPKTDPGQVVFFDAHGNFKAAVEVGALPDMLTFTPDGKQILVANEGEPSSYDQPDSVDPVGSVSIIDLTNGVEQATVTTAEFESFNDQKADLQAKGVRIFGPNATVAQDLEPEYISFSADGKTAYVTLQENNALGVIDIATATATAIVPLGLKDYSKGLPTVTTYEWNNRPVLGTTATSNPANPEQMVLGQEILLGGFSGLFFEGKTDDGKLKFVTHTDRGPNGEPTDLLPNVAGDERPFALPDFQPQIVRFELDPVSGEINLTQQIGLTREDGTPLTGLPNLQTDIAGTAYTDEVPVDLFGNRLENDPLGADLEGIVTAGDGSFWLVDEYRPAIYHFDHGGKLIERFIPEGEPTESGFGTPVLPEVYAQRRANRGFEAVALEGDKLYAFIQSPIDNPDSAADTVSRNSRNLRILEFDIVSKQVTGEYLYTLDSISASGTAKTDKIGDAVSLGGGKFLVVERDDRSTANSNKLIYEIDLTGATNLSNVELAGDKTIEQLSVAELDSLDLDPVTKRLVTNAAATGYTGVEKLEGLALVDANTIALLNDNDFGLAGGTVSGDGTIEGLTNTPVKVGLVQFNQSNGLDASDRDGVDGEGAINIQFQPVFGLYQPDAIASFSINGQTYLVTANEGDAREYDGFEEEIRVGDEEYVLDPTRFPNAEALKQDAVLGRLTVSTASGDTDGDGDYDRIETLGARSFSIRDGNGNLVFDSGDQLEKITAKAIPELFNSDESLTEEFDNRSDNKGPEPEGATIGVVNDRTYAFIGLERTGGVMVYEVTNPNQPVFVEYVITEGDVAPEGLTFISADDSPNGKSLLVVTNEVSGTVAVFEFAPPTRISEIQGAGHLSPLVDQAVNTSGIVTAVTSNGFYLQDPNPDANSATSEGIFVFRGSDGSKPVIGDSVAVTGTVSEFRGVPTRNNDLSVTQITATSDDGFTVLSSGNALPDAIVIGKEGRIPPNQIINNDAVDGSVEGSPFDPDEDGIDFYESLEGMRVQVNDAVVVGPTNNFGEIPVLADNGANAGERTSRGGIYIQPDDFNPERIIIDDVIVRDEPKVNVGDQFNGAITGVLDYSFSNFKLLNTEPLSVTSGNLEREVTELVGSEDQLTIATFNVENLDPLLEDVSRVNQQSISNVDDDLGDGKFDALADQIVNNLKSPDIISLEEIQDNTGAEINDGVVDASLTYQTLIDAVEQAGGPSYEFRDIPPVEGQDGGQPGGNIRVGFLFNPARVSFVDRSGGGSTVDTTVTNGEISASPSRLIDTDLSDGDAFEDSRKPLVGEFVFNGETVYVVGNHFNSKGGDQPLFGRFQPPTLTTEPQRREQAQIVREFVDDLLAADSNANVAVVGDLNDFQFSQPLDILTEGGALANLFDTLPANEQYTYNFEGNAQVLDHILVSQNLKSVAEIDVVHINSEFAQQESDHDPIVSRFSFGMNTMAIASGLHV